MNALTHFREAVKTHSTAAIARSLGLHNNTVQRWHEQGRVPPHYAPDLRRLLGLPTLANDAAGEAHDKDQYYTKPAIARHCVDVFARVAGELGVDLSRYHFIEPSAGCGEFYKLLPRGRRIGVDLAPAAPGIIQRDYLTWTPPPGRHVVVGNPPFGLRGHLALQFINHSNAFADMVGMILPQLFASDGKGVPAKRVIGYALAHNEKLPADSFTYPNGDAVAIHTVFQVWTKVGVQRIARPRKKTCARFIRVYSLSDGGTPASTRNRDMIGHCDVYIPSTCFGGMRAFGNFSELPHARGYGVLIHRDKRAIKKLLLAHDWSRTAFHSTNSAVNMRKSLIESVVIDAGYCDE